MRTSVDLPAPFGPITQTTSPGATVNDTSVSAVDRPPEEATAQHLAQRRRAGRRSCPALRRDDRRAPRALTGEGLAAALVFHDRGVVLGDGARELVGAVVLGDEVEERRVVGRQHRLQRRASRVRDRPGRQPFVRVRVVRVVAIVELDAVDAAVPLLAGGGPLNRDRAAIDDGRVGLQQLGHERRHVQAVDEHLRDARALLGAARLLLDDRREHDDVVVLEPQRLLQLQRRLGVGGAQLAPHLAVPAHQRDQRARRRAARAQAVRVREQIALQRVARQPQLRGERGVARLGGQLVLAGDAGGREDLGDLEQVLARGHTTVTSSSAAPFTSVSRICFGDAGAMIS